MERLDFDLSHAVINSLYSSYQGRFAALNATQKMGGQIDAAGQKEWQTRLDTIGNWGKALWQGTPLIVKSQTSEQANQAFHFLKLLQELLQQTAGETETALVQKELPKENIFRELTAIFLWYAYARDNYLKGLLAYCDAVQDRNQAQQYRQILPSCQQEIRMGHEFMLSVTDGLKDPGMLWIRLHGATVNLPGMFRSQAADIDILRARYDGKLNYGSVGIEEREAIQWSQMGIPADIAAYWKAYSMSPDETAQWKLAKFDDPSFASSWRSRDFTPKQAAEWRSQGFNAKKAALNRDMGYTDPSIAKSWEEETQKQQQRNAEEQARQEELKAQQLWQEKGISEEETAEWKRRGFKDADTAGQWRQSNFTPQEAQSWKNYGFQPTDAASWKQTGFEKAHEAQRWLKADLPPSEAVQWKEKGFSVNQFSNFADRAEAFAYIELGETPAAALNWKKIEQSPEQVKAWKEAGITSDNQVKQWLVEQIGAEEAGRWTQAGISKVQDVKAWQEAEFSAETAATWRTAGFASPQDTMEWRDKGCNDPAQAAAERRKSPEFVKGFLTRLMFIAKDRPQDVVIQLGVNTDLLNKQFLAAYTEVAKSMMPKGEKERIYFAGVFGWIADCLRRLVNGNPAMNTELALGCLLSLKEMLKDNFPGARLQIEFWTAKALISRQKGDKSKNIEKALAMLLEIDKLVNNVTSPKFWAEVQQAIGWGLSERQAGDRRKNLLIAVKRYDAALTVYTKEKFPTDHDFTAAMKQSTQEKLSMLKDAF